MSLLQSSASPFLQYPFPSKLTSHPRNLHHKNFLLATCFPKPSSRNHRRLTPVLAYSGIDSESIPTHEFLESLSRTNSEKLPAVRTYENDLGRLVLIGDVISEQAIVAAASDGGVAAEEHIDSGLTTMVVETVYPGSSGEHSTVSTRLFLPAKKVKEKARKLRSSLSVDILSSTMPRNILAITFRQVIVQHLWSFELSLFAPGNERDMEDLANPREAPVVCSLSSSDDRIVSALAEAVCSCALAGVKRDFHQNTDAVDSNNVFHWFWKPKMISSADSSVYVCETSQDEVVGKAKNVVENFNSIKGKEREVKSRGWWPSPIYSSTWTREYVPAYRLQVDADKFKDVKFEGWKKSANNRWEVLLSHSQMVGLADILDMFYEDIYAIPGKQLPCRMIAKFSNLSKSKSSFWKMLLLTLTGGFVLLSINILAQFCWPQLVKTRKSTTESYSISLPDIDFSQRQSEATKPIILSNIEASDAIEALCTSVVKSIKDSLHWSGDIKVDTDVGAWTGEIPNYLKLRSVEQEFGSGSEGAATTCSSGDVLTDAHDIASYQVVLTRDGKIIGFQPTSRVGVNHWASNPLAKSLYGGRKLSPGFLEPSLKIPRPDEVFLIELLMSTNPATQFALARPMS